MTYCILLTGQILWVVYGLLVDDKIVICANLVSGLLSLLIIVFFNVYKKREEITSVLQRPIQQRTNAIVTLSN